VKRQLPSDPRRDPEINAAGRRQQLQHCPCRGSDDADRREAQIAHCGSDLNAWRAAVGSLPRFHGHGIESAPSAQLSLHGQRCTHDFERFVCHGAGDGEEERRVVTCHSAVRIESSRSIAAAATVRHDSPRLLRCCHGTAVATAVRVTPSFSIMKRELRLRQEDSRRCLSLVHFLAQFPRTIFPDFYFPDFSLSSVLLKRWLSNLQHVQNMLLLVHGPTQDQPSNERNVPSRPWERFDASSSLRFYQGVRIKLQVPSAKRQAPTKLATAQRASRVRFRRTKARSSPTSAQARSSEMRRRDRSSSLRGQVRCRRLRLQAHALHHKQVPCALHATEDGSSPRRRPSSVRSSSRSGASKFTRASFSLQGAIAGPSLQASRGARFFLSSSDVSILKQARSSLLQAPKSQSSLLRCKQAH
jgi:hypothetical protein